MDFEKNSPDVQTDRFALRQLPDGRRAPEEHRAGADVQRRSDPACAYQPMFQGAYDSPTGVVGARGLFDELKTQIPQPVLIIEGASDKRSAV